MFIIPSYVSHYESDGAIFISSQLRANTIKLTDPQIIQEFRAILKYGGCVEIKSDLEHFLHDQQLLLNHHEIGVEIQELRDVMNESLLITMMPTEICNFRCTYCYEDHVANTMSRETLEGIKEYLTKQAAHFKKISISWFGGEPTLCKDTVLETARAVQSLQKIYGFEYLSSMTTNGYLLSKADFIMYLSAGITSYQITLDGWDHDKTRPHVTGSGTLQTILRNLQEISALPKDKYSFNIMLRYNILPNSNCDSWYDYLYKLFGEDTRFCVLVRPVGNLGGDSVNSMELFNAENGKAARQKHIDYLREIGMQSGEAKNAPLSHICYAAFPHSMVFRADGTIEKCTVALNHPKNRVGYVDSEQGVVLDDAINKIWSTMALNPDCLTCSNVLSCLNMQCPKARIVNGAEHCYYAKVNNSDSYIEEGTVDVALS